jgi:hypothetical protein
MKGCCDMSEFGTRLDQAEARLDKAQATLDAVGRLLEMAEKTQVSVAERAGESLRRSNVMMMGTIALLGIVVLAVRRRH